jgi:uncharacterized protein
MPPADFAVAFTASPAIIRTVEEFTLEVDGISLAAQMHLPAEGEPPFPAVILCHGIPTGQPPDPTDGGYPALAEQMAGRGLAAFTFSFRGAGLSGGNFEMAGWSHDLAAMIGNVWNLEAVDDSRVALAGFSAGAAVAIYVAAEDKRVAAVAACASPMDFAAIYSPANAAGSLAYFRRIGLIREAGFPPSLEEWLNGFRRINALHSVPQIAPRPLLLVHGSADKVVPPENSRRLYAAAGDPRKLVILDGAEHRLRLHSGAVETLLDWLGDVLPPERK